jgi:hypothetical protein
MLTALAVFQLFIYLFAPCAGVVANAQKWVYFNGGDKGCKDGKTSGCDNIRQLIHDHWFCGNVTTHDDGEQHCGAGMFDGNAEKWASLAWTLARIVFWVGVAWCATEHEALQALPLASPPCALSFAFRCVSRLLLVQGAAPSQMVLECVSAVGAGLFPPPPSRFDCSARGPRESVRCSLFVF